MLGGRSKQRIDRGTEAVFARPFRQAHAAAIDDEVRIGRCNVDVAVSEGLALSRRRHTERPDAIKDRRQQSRSFG
jgi:hypothetical protein